MTTHSKIPAIHKVVTATMLTVAIVAVFVIALRSLREQFVTVTRTITRRRPVSHNFRTFNHANDAESPLQVQNINNEVKKSPIMIATTTSSRPIDQPRNEKSHAVASYGQKLQAQRAIDILNGRRRPERPTTDPKSTPKTQGFAPDAQGKPELKGTPSVAGMKDWLHRIGHSTAAIDNLNIIHVAGTKGKGSTCAFIESFLRAHGERTERPLKTGLYTSPHLIYPEERIRINFQPIARERFARYFFEVWNLLSTDSENLPRYLQLFALISFHAFIKENVNVAIYETHHGGEYDATNVIEHPVATVITALGMDHVQQLGPTIENIAWNKAGIFKRGAHAFSSPQEASAAEVLRARAAEEGVHLQFVENDPDLPADAPQLKPDVQRTNCSVALAAVRHFLRERPPKDASQLSSPVILRGISQFSWPGRFQTIVEGPFSWYLDGAHNEMSVSKAAEWFIESSQGGRASPVRILIFGQVSKQRDAKLVLEQLAIALSPIHIDHVIFTSYDPKQDFESTTAVIPKLEDLDALQGAFRDIWKRVHPNSHILYEPIVQRALELAREIGTVGGMQTIITGSQHLVGAALFSLNDCASDEGFT